METQNTNAKARIRAVSFQLLGKVSVQFQECSDAEIKQIRSKIQKFPTKPAEVKVSVASWDVLVTCCILPSVTLTRETSWQEPDKSMLQPFVEGNGPARQGLCGLDFRPCLSSELSSPSVPLAAARARHTRQQWSCGPEATAAL